MRSSPAFILRLGTLVCALAACAGARGPAPRSVAATARSSRPESAHPALELAEVLPSDAERCVVSAPSLVPLSERPLVGLLSQADELPWALAIDVTAFARAELESADERRVLTYVRFARPDHPRIRRELDKLGEHALDWGEASRCEDELTCAPASARFVDDRTVLITAGAPPRASELGAGHGACVELLRREPRAVEVSAQRSEFALAVSGRASETVLEVEGGRISRTTRRQFADERAAESSLTQWFSGREEVPSVAGIPVDASVRRAGTVVEQRAEVALEDLWIVVEDQTRLRRALSNGDEPNVPSSQIDVHDVDAVRAHVDRALAEIAKLPPLRREPRLSELDELLERARREHVSDESLSRRHFSLRMEFRRDACGAFDVAEARLLAGAADEVYWRLAQRRALASCSEPRLKAELARAHGLGDREAGQMAAELVARVRHGADYERSEWAFLTARALSQRAKRERLRHVSEGELPLAMVPRVLAYLGRLSEEHEASDFGVHVLAFGVPDPAFGSEDSLVWSAPTNAAGRPGTVFAAATWDDGQLVAEGRALAARFADGPIELVVGLDPIASPRASRNEGGLLRLAGRVERGELFVERASRAVAHVRFELLQRYIVAPLEAMHGAQFPPDELSLQAENQGELEAIVHAGELEAGMRCAREALLVRCRGSLDDTRAAGRALVRVARTVLAREGRALWSGAE